MNRMPRGAIVGVLLVVMGLAGCFDGNADAEPPAPTTTEPHGDCHDPAIGMYSCENPPACVIAGNCTAPEPEVNVSVPEPRPAPLRFIAVGDTGSGNADQFAVAQAMELVCRVRGCDFVVMLGDNFYEDGVKDEYDPQFESKFERPYQNLSVPFYVTLGNHDNSGDPVTQGVCELEPTGETCLGPGHWHSAGDAEVRYHYREDRTTDRWFMPARHYAVDVPNATLLSLDTNTMMYAGVQLGADSQEAAVREQGAWFDAAIANSTMPWKIAFGHHPYISNGAHGNAGNYESGRAGNEAGRQSIPHPVSGFYVKEFMETHVCGQTDLYLSGHDHILSWLEPNAACGETQFIVSGAGGKVRPIQDPERNPTYFEVGDTLGFFWLELTPDALYGAVYDQTASLLFEQTVENPAN